MKNGELRGRLTLPDKRAVQVCSLHILVWDIEFEGIHNWKNRWSWPFLTGINWLHDAGVKYLLLFKVVMINELSKIKLKGSATKMIVFKDIVAQKSLGDKFNLENLICRIKT